MPRRLQSARSSKSRGARVGTGIRTAITRLTDEQLQEAEAAFLRLKGRPRSLSAYLDFALVNYREPQVERPLDAANRHAERHRGERPEQADQRRGHEHEVDLAHPRAVSFFRGWHQ